MPALKSPKSILNVFGYTDYRQYLADFYRLRKEGPRGYSYRNFSKAAGFSSPNILKLVMDGQRNLSAESVEKFIIGLGLEGKMAAYFRALVRMNQAQSTEEKASEYEVLKALIPLGKRRELGTTTMQYLSHWLYPVIREMVMLKSFSYDPYWISRRIVFDVSISEISQVLSFLNQHGFIEKLEDGKFKVKDHAVASSDEIKSLAVRSYHKKILDQATKVIDILPLEQREFGALTFILPDEAQAELKQRLKDFKQDLHKWAMQVASEVSDGAVVQVNIQMYPQTKGGMA